MRKLPILKEALLSTILILITVFLINFFPFKYELVKPIKQDFGDFDIYDLHYSKLQNEKKDTNIVLVQIGDTRDEIQKQLKLLSAYKPAVIGIDVDFKKAPDEAVEDSVKEKRIKDDSVLKKQIHDMPQVVTGHRMVIDHITGHLEVQPNYFDDDSTIRNRSGYFNFIGEEISVIRQYAPFYKLDSTIEYALTSRILEKFKPDLFQKLKKRKNKIEAINYSGNTEHYVTITREELMKDSVTKEFKKNIKGKIVLLGVFYTTPPLLMDDIHFTPLNRKISGKSLPDMYGVVIHANVLSMLLSGKYIKMKSEKFTYLLAFLIVFFITLYQLRLHKRKIHMAHWKMILFQVVAIVLLVYIFFLVFSFCHVRVDLLPAIIAIVLSVEVFGPYRRAAEWITKKITRPQHTRRKKSHKK